MKFTPNDYSILSGAIKRHLALYTTEELATGIKQFIESSKANNKYIAFIWAIFFKVRRSDMTINDMIHERTYNDSHIETALKNIFKEYGINNKLELTY